MSANVSASPGNSGGSSSTPDTGPTHYDSVMDCSDDPTQFTLVSIHTAKCAKCDKRNMDRMRRCPGCTYQVCQPCFVNMHGAPLTHGNVDSSPGGISSAPLRRRLFARAGAPSLPTTAGLSVVLSSDGSGIGEGGPVIQTTVSGNGGADQTADTAKADAEDTGVGAQEPNALVTPRSSVKRPRKAKVKTPIVDQSSSDDNFMPDLESPTPAQKRRRAVSEMKGDNNNIPSRRSSRVPTQGNASPSPSATTQSTQLSLGRNRSTSATSNNFQGRIGAGFLRQNGNEDQEMENDGILGREKGDGTIQQLLEQQGVDKPGSRYKEHLLLRRQPVIYNPIIPLNLGLSHNVRRSISESEEIVQNGTTQKLQKMHDGPEKVLQGDVDMVKHAVLPKISDLVESNAFEVIQDLKLTEDQKAAVHAHAMASASLLIVKFNSMQATSAQHRPKLELGTSSVEHLTAAMTKELKDKIEEDIVLVLNHFNPPDKDELDRSEPTKVHLGLKPNEPRSLPPVGKFQVSPVRLRARPLAIGLRIGSRPLPSGLSDSASSSMDKQGGFTPVDAKAEGVSTKAEDNLSFSPTPLNSKQPPP